MVILQLGVIHIWSMDTKLKDNLMGIKCNKKVSGVASSHLISGNILLFVFSIMIEI